MNVGQVLGGDDEPDLCVLSVAIPRELLLGAIDGRDFGERPCAGIRHA